MSKDNLKTILSHNIPPVFHKYPGLIKIGYGISYLNQLRKWHVKARLNELVKQHSSHQFSFIDAGCGEGQYMFPLAAKYPNAKVTGIDKAEGNIRFANTYIRHRPFKNVAVVQGAIEESQPVEAADIVMCVGVMHFVEEDKAAMSSLAEMVKPGGKLLLEVPVNGKSVTPFYQNALKKYGGYDSINGRKHHYSPADLKSLVSDAGLEINSVTYAYGTAGRLGHELYNAPLVMMLSGNILERLTGALVINLIYPLVLFLFTLDYCIKQKEGNCMIVIASKN